MAEKEKQRIKQMKHMEEAERKRQAAKAPPLTQAERMAEASRTEKKNAKSLNRWEEAEKKKAEAQKAKLEALRNRQLAGPVITWWSGLARWVNGKLGQVGIKEIKRVEGTDGVRDRSQQQQDPPRFSASTGLPRPERGAEIASLDKNEAQPVSSSSQTAEPLMRRDDPEPTVTFATPLGPGGLLDGIHYYASLPPFPGQGTAAASEHHQREISPAGAPLPPLPEPVSPVPIEHPAAFVEKPITADRLGPQKLEQYRPPSRPKVEYSSRNLIALQNIDHNATSLPELQISVLLRRRSTKPPSGHSIPITIKAALADHFCRAKSRAMRHLRVSGKVP